MVRFMVERQENPGPGALRLGILKIDGTPFTVDDAVLPAQLPEEFCHVTKKEPSAGWAVISTVSPGA